MSAKIAVFAVKLATDPDGHDSLMFGAIRDDGTTANPIGAAYVYGLPVSSPVTFPEEYPHLTDSV